MKATERARMNLLTCGAALFAASLMADLDLQAQDVREGKAVARAIRGTVKYSTGDGVWVPLRIGIMLRSGAMIQTAAESNVDLFLGVNGPVVRVSADTMVAFERLTFQDTGVDTIIETQLDLKSGRILGNVRKLAAESRYEIRTPNGVAGIRGTDYEIRVTSKGDGQFEVTYTSITGTLVVALMLAGINVTAVINTGETWTPRAAGDRPMPIPPEVLAALRRELYWHPHPPHPPHPPITVFAPDLIEFISPITGR